MKRFAILAAVLIFTGACDDSPTTPSNPDVAKFTAVLLPGNEVPAVTNADASASGTMQLTMTVTRDASNAITGATYDFVVNMTGFPANTTLTGAHIHNAPAGTNTGVVVNLNLAANEFVLPSGQLTINRPGIVGGGNAATTPAATAQGVFNNAAGNYFNVHTTLNTGGAIRGQLVRIE